MELMVKKQMPKESIEILNEAKQNINKILKEAIQDSMEAPFDKKENYEPYFESYTLGLVIVDILQELLESGFDMLSELNDKPECFKRLMATRQSQNFQFL
jgi:hypothetical protein